MRAIFCTLKKFIVARQAEHCMMDERLQIQYSILLFKTISVARHAGHYIRDERLQVEGSNQKILQVNTIFAFAKTRGRAQPSLWQCSAKTSTR